MQQFKNSSCEILDELKGALGAVQEEDVKTFVSLLTGARKVFFIGVGRVMLSLEAMAKRFAHLGIDCHVVGEITEPAITKEDILVVGSGSGNSLIPVAIAKKAHSLGAKVVHIGSNKDSQIKDLCSLMVRIPVRTKAYLEDEIDSKQPMTSLFEQALYLFGDTVAKMLVEASGVELSSLWEHHANLE